MTPEYKLTDTLVRATDITMKFGDNLVLRPTSIEVKDIVRPDVCQGQVVGILGPSGCGKTTFARILAGLQEPTTGTVLVANSDKPSEMLSVMPGLVGMVAQNYPLFPWRTLEDNLWVALEHTDLVKGAKEAKVSKYLNLFGLSDKRKLFPAQLSGGQRQRASIIRELLCSEHYLVMDEPFTGLDPIMKDRLCETISKVAQIHEHNTIFVVAHDIEALIKISDCLWLFGRDKNEKGEYVMGSTIKKSYNLIERDLAWHPEVDRTREFADFRNEVKAEFQNL
jgi:polar amino acid transport system ATP-binding protein/sulfate transport system ATP-binding protein